MQRVRVVGYVRVSSDQQAESGAGLVAQRRAIQREADRRGWELVEIFEDAGASGKHVYGRPGLSAALEALESGRAAALLVAKLDRLSCSLVDFAELMERSRRMNWDIVALDLGVDTSTPSGEMMANVLAVFAQFERRLIGERTRDALAAKRTQGIRLGRPPSLPRSVRHRIMQERERGKTLASIAERLNADGVPTAHGGQRWYPATIRKILTANP
jgi:DNA invertase Pin-like site-specific DNA recombinase